MAPSGLAWFVVAILWFSFCWHLKTAGWWPRKPTQRSIVAAIGLLALGLTILTPQVYRWLDSLTGIPNLSRLIGNGCGVVAGWVISPLRTRLLRRGDGQGILSSPWLMLTVLVATTVLFWLAPVDQSEPGDFASHFAHSGFVVAYRALLMGYVGTVLGQLCWASWRNRTRLSTALRGQYLLLRNRLHVAGCGCGTAFALHEALYPALGHADLALLGPGHRLLSTSLLAAFVLLLMAGNFLSVARWANLYLAWLALFPAWRDLHSLLPSVADNNVYPPPRTWAENLRACNDLEYRVLSRLLEFADGLVALRPYATDPAVATAVVHYRRAGVPAEEAEAVLNATLLVAAKRAPGQITGEARGRAVPPGRPDLDSELNFYLCLARAYRRSSLAAACRRSLGPGRSSKPSR